MRLPLALLAALAITVPPSLGFAADEDVHEAPRIAHDEGLARPLEVHFIDVGQGDAMLIRSPAGKTVLIDAGNIGAGSAVNDYLEDIGVTTLDLAVGTHPHMDHMGGMVEVLEKHHPKRYMDPGFQHPIDHYAALLEWLEANDVPIVTAAAGRNITLEPGIVLSLFAPEQPLLSGTRSDVNSNSIVMRLTYGDVSFLFTGDAEDETEQRVMRYTDDLASTVLKVAHHGGRHSTSDTWLGRVQPKFAVISAGARNRYKHPTKETLGRLAARDVEVYRTDLHGDVIARTNGRQISWETTGERSAKLDEAGGRSSYSRPKSTPTKSRSPTNVAVAKPPQTDSAPALVDINQADEATLMTLPGIGKKTAEDIIKDRAEHGPFPDLLALTRIRGIGKQKVEKLVGHAVAHPPPVDTPSALPSKPANEDIPSSDKTLPPIDLPTSQSERLFARATRVNINIAPAKTIAEAAHVAFDQALRVEEDRKKNGPFQSVEQLSRVVGLQPAAREAIVRVGIVRIELNRVTPPQLVALGLKREEAEAVVAYRQKEGAFRSVDELEDVEALPADSRERLLPLLTVGSSK